MTRPVLVHGLVCPKENQAATWTANWFGKQPYLLRTEILY